MGTSSSSRTQAHYRILMVDDNSLGLDARKSVLEEHGYEVVSVTCPDEALERLSKRHFDLLITDYRMPAMTGVDLIRRARENQNAVAAILLSGFVEPLGLDQKNTGADAVIQKNANELSHLLRAVRSLLRPAARRRPPKSDHATEPPKPRKKKA
jgi:CheY-like chemotaxis protein